MSRTDYRLMLNSIRNAEHKLRLAMMRIAIETDEARADVAEVAGLLHILGDVLAAQHDPDAESERPKIEVEPREPWRDFRPPAPAPSYPATKTREWPTDDEMADACARAFEPLTALREPIITEHSLYTNEEEAALVQDAANAENDALLTIRETQRHP